VRPSVALGWVGALVDLVERPKDAVPVLRTAHEKLGPLFLVPLAVALEGAQTDDESVRFAREACEKAPQDVGAAYVLAALLARRGQKTEADQALAKAQVPGELRAAFAELDKDELILFAELLVLRRHGVNRDGAVLAKKLCERRAKNLVVALHAARALAATGEQERATAILEGAVAAAPRFVPCRLELGYLRRLSPAGAEAALRTYEEGAALLPGEPALELAIGVSRSELGKHEAAERAYRAVLERDEKNLVARNNLAWLLLTKGTPEALSEGFALAEAVVRDAPTSGSALDTLARIELARGDAPGAVQHAQKAIELSPLDATIRLGLAKALDAVGKKREAANQYEVALLLAEQFQGRQEAEQRLAQLRETLLREKKS
jgi:Flp pilus assembly protein TadD